MVGINKLSLFAIMASLMIASSSSVRAMESEGSEESLSNIVYQTKSDKRRVRGLQDSEGTTKATNVQNGNLGTFISGQNDDVQDLKKDQKCCCSIQ